LTTKKDVYVAQLFIQTKADWGWEIFSATIAEVLNVRIDKRESINWPDGIYYHGAALGLRVTLSLADDSDFPDYQLSVSFRSLVSVTQNDRYRLDGFADLVARFLAAKGFKVARPFEPGRVGTEWEEYGEL
jgi:hypothetical protein